MHKYLNFVALQNQDGTASNSLHYPADDNFPLQVGREEVDNGKTELKGKVKELRVPVQG